VSVQSARLAAPTLWTRRFAKKPAGGATGSLPSARPAIAGTPTVRGRVGRSPAGDRSGPRDGGTVAVLKGASIIAIINARIAPA
jgi:hypothetical protein